MPDKKPVPSPGDYLRDELAARNWTQDDLAKVLDRPRPTINRILQGKHAILPEMAVALGAAFGNDPEVWMAREAAYKLSLVQDASDEIRRRVRLYEIAPIKDMEKRQWIKPTDGGVDLEAELKRFFGVDSLDSDPQIAASMRRAGDAYAPLSPCQRAWCFRVRQLGSALLAAEYRDDRLDKCAAALRKVAAYPQEAHKVATTLASYGIRFVIVEPLPGCKVDGVALWADGSPIIGMAAHYDRVDNFWFTLFHELSHVRHRDAEHLDIDLHADQPLDVKPPIEVRADAEGADALVSKKEMDSFVLRVGPLYSKDRIIRFANRIKMHPGIIVGQLQKRGEIGYHANREMLVKIRHVVTPAVPTDGWGYSIDPRKLP